MIQLKSVSSQSQFQLHLMTVSFRTFNNPKSNFIENLTSICFCWKIDQNSWMHSEEHSRNFYQLPSQMSYRKFFLFVCCLFWLSLFEMFVSVVRAVKGLLSHNILVNHINRNRLGTMCVCVLCRFIERRQKKGGAHMTMYIDHTQMRYIKPTFFLLVPRFEWGFVFAQYCSFCLSFDRPRHYHICIYLVLYVPFVRYL